MPIKGFGIPGGSQNVGPNTQVPTRLTAAGANTSDLGKVALDITNPMGSVQKSAEGLFGGLQGIGKAAVSIIENIPIAGLVTRPVIGAVGAVADATVGRVVDAVAQSPIGEAVDTVANKAFEVVTLPLVGAVKGLTVASEFVQKVFAGARITATANDEKNWVRFVFGDAPQSAVAQVRAGKDVNEIADEWVGQFGSGPAQEGAFSQDALANFVWTIILDPLNLVPFGKPVAMASRAAKLSIAGVDGLRAASKGLRVEARLAARAGDKVLSKRLIEEAVARADDAKFLEKYDWAGKVYKSTWGKVSDAWGRVGGGRLSREIAQAPDKIIGGKASYGMLDDIEVATSKSNVDEALGNAVLTTANASKAAVNETLVSTQRNIWKASSQALVKNLFTAMSEGKRGVDNLLGVEFGTNKTIKNFLDELGLRPSEANDLIATLEKSFVPSPKAFYTSDGTRSIVGQLTDIMSKIDVRARPDFYVNAAEALGKSNIRFAVDAGVELIQRNKLRLTSLTTDRAGFIDYLSRSLQYGFRLSADKAQEIATAQFEKHATNPRDLLNVLETGRMSSFGRAMREVATERAVEADNLVKLDKAAAGRHAAVAKAYYSELPREQAIAAGAAYDQVAITSAALEGITPNEWYAKYTFGISGLSLEDAAMSVVDELYSTTEQAKGAFAKAITNGEILKAALDIVPTKRMIDAGLTGKLVAEVIQTPRGGFALPGGVAALSDPAPYNIIDEIVLSTQPYEIVEALPGDIRVKMHLKMTASKNIDMRDPIAVANRVVFALLSPQQNLTGNAAVYQALRIGNADELAAFVARYGDDIKNLPNLDEGASARLGKRIARDFGFGEEDNKLTGVISNISNAARALVLAKENPAFFLIKNGESLPQFAERLTLLYGVRLKVGSFAVEMMRTSEAAVGAIDAQMSWGILKWSMANGTEGKLLKELRDIGTAESKKYAEELESLIPKIKAGDNVYGPSANGSGSTLGPKTIEGSNASIFTKADAGTLPNWAIAKEASPTVTLLEGSSFQVMNRYVTAMADEWATVGRLMDDGQRVVYTGLDKMSGAQKQWFIWDISRKQLEPHQWLHRDVDKLAKPTIEQIRKAVSAIRAAGGFTKGRKFGGIDPRIAVEFLDERGGQVLGKTQFDTKGRSVIQLFKGADITTAIHEIGHVARRQLSRQDQRVVNAIYGVTDSWTVEFEERFAKDFTNYMYSGKAPSPALIDLFGKIRQWMTDLWSKVSGTEQIHPEMRKVFDRLLSHNGPQPLPDADTWSRITLISDRSLTQEARESILRRVNTLLGEGDGSETLRTIDEANSSIVSRVDGGLVKERDGASFNPIRDTELVVGTDFGFTASVYPGREVVLSGTDRIKFLTDKAFQKQVLVKFVQDNEDLIALDGHYVGLYDNGASYSVDVSRSFDSVQDAIEAGTRSNQEAIFTLKGGKDIYLDTPLGRLAAEKEGESIIRNASEISNADLASWSKPRPDANKLEAMFRPLADELIAKYEDVAVKWWNTDAPAIDVIDWVRDHPEVMVRELTDIEKRLLPEGFKAKQAAIQLGGYRYAVAPKGGIIERSARVSDGFGGTRISTSAQPFVDLLDTVAINKLDEIAGRASKRPTFLNKFTDILTREYGPDVVRTNYVERFVTDITKKVKINTRDAEIILAKVGNLAARKETTVRGLWFERDQVQTIFREALGDAEYFRYIEKNDPLTDLLLAAQGDVSVVGLLPGLSGRAKVWKPVMGAITDRAFPLFRFGKGNPFFRQILEPIETKLMAMVDGIKRDQLDEFLGGKPSTLIQRMTQDTRTVTNEIAESVFYDQERAAVASLSAVREAPEFVDAVSKVLAIRKTIKAGKWSIQNPEEYKLIMRDIMASEYAVDKMFSMLQKTMPESMEHLSLNGTLDGRAIMARILEDGMIQSSPEAFSAALAREAGPTIGLWGRALAETGIPQTEARRIAAATHGVFVDAMIRGTRRADKYQFFSSYRSWFERSINHPFLGVYPYSYMTQKAIPWMLKVMFAPKIGGHIRPGYGFINMMRLREYLAVDANTDRDFMTQIASARPLWYALNIMLPATPTNMGFATPYWLRKGILQPAQQGKPVDFAQISTVPGLIGETVFRGTVIGQGASLIAGAGAFGDTIENSLDDAQLDINRFFNP